jgi:hypothetical protein
MSDDRRDEPFLSRWSRQKRRETDPAPQPTEAPEAADPPAVDLSKLPRIEDLTADSDITGFLQQGVPEVLQRLALRRMWSLDPAIRDFVEMAENQWDFNAAGGVPGLFEEIAPGTDVGVWLAQATQSVVSGQGDPVSSAADAAAAAQQITVTEEPVAKFAVPADQVGRPAAGEDRVRKDEAPENIVELAKEENASASLSQPRRGRHGGALPR